MPATAWILAALVVAALAVGVGVVHAVRGRHRTYVPARPATISVAGPVEDVLESPRHAAEARAAAAELGGTTAEPRDPGA